MGCGVPSEKKKDKTVVENVPNEAYLKSTPQSFVTINTKKFTDVYKVGKVLGSGSFGEVRSIIHRITQQERAAKIFRKDGQSRETYLKIRSEIENLKKLEHPTVIKLYEYFEDEKRIYLVLEKCNGGELFDEVFKNKYLNEKSAAIIAKQLFSVTAYLHDNFIVHRDLKPENILLEDKQDYLNIKLIDFGAATLFEPNIKLTEMIGSAFYISPEVTRYNYNELCDEWSCGVIIYILLSGTPPFPGNTNEEIIGKIRTGKYNFSGPIWDSVSENAKDLIAKLLCPSKNRITAKQALVHPWIQGQGNYPEPSHEFLTRTMENLQHFHLINKFRDAISVFISSQVLNHEDTKDLRELFKSMDENGDGKLSAEEMKKGFSQLSDVLDPDEYIEKIMKEVDTDGNGFIDYNEFLKATIDEKIMYSKVNLRTAFEMFDLDHSGKISLAELQQIFCLGNMKIDILESIVNQADSNSDGEIDFGEFCSFIEQVSRIQ